MSSQPSQPSSSRFSGLHLSGRALSAVLFVVVVVGAMAFYRARTGGVPGWTSFGGSATSTGAPLPSNAVASLLNENEALEQVAAHVAPAVVRVEVTSRTSPGENGGGQMGGGDNPLSQFFGQFGQMQPPQRQIENGIGSGVIISPDGYIVTNNHVVEGAIDIRCYFSDNRERPGKVVGTDTLTDLAVVKVDGSNLPNLPWGDSNGLKQGDTVFAFGNPFGILGTSMTRGIVSGLGRPSPDTGGSRSAPQDFIQTDAAINPGNSGGPLVDARGDVVGINSFILTDSGSFNGAGFAIPSQIAEPTARELIAHGKVVRGYMGITIEPFDPAAANIYSLPANAQGAWVSAVDPNTPAAAAGMKYGDLITNFNGKPVADPSQLQILTGQTPPGTHVNVGILRDGKPMTLGITLGTLPPDEQTAANGAPGGPGGPGGANRGRNRNMAPPETPMPLGIVANDLDPATRNRYEIPDDVQGALITGVTPGSAAENAYLTRGDVITEVDRKPVANADQLRAALQAATTPGAPNNGDVILRVYEQGSYTFRTVRPESMGGGAPAGGTGGQP